MQIRNMKSTDYDAAYQLWMGTAGMGLNTIDDSPEGIDRFLKRNPSTCFVAMEEEQVLGVILSGHDGRRGFIYHLSVKEEERRKGIGKALVAEALDALREEQITKVALVVFSRNETGNAFWESIGFTARTDLTYRNALISSEELVRIDT